MYLRIDLFSFSNFQVVILVSYIILLHFFQYNCLNSVLSEVIANCYIIVKVKLSFEQIFRNECDVSTSFNELSARWIIL